MSIEYKLSPISHLGKYLSLPNCFDGKLCSIVGSYGSFLPLWLYYINPCDWQSRVKKEKEEAQVSANFMEWCVVLHAGVSFYTLVYTHTQD